MDESHTKTVLIVEDSPTQAMHIQTLLEAEGIHVLWACDGRAGLKIAQDAQPDLIILDLQMPKMNGLQVCTLLKEYERTRGIPVIMFTAHDEQETVYQSLQLGIVDFIPKDVFADAVLIETLRQMGFCG